MMTDLCFVCRHLDNSKPGLACKAFPNGIPEAIITGEVDHDRPYKGDGGIRFSPVDDLSGATPAEREAARKARRRV